MKTNDIWYGVLEAGSKTSPVVRDLSMQASNNSIWLYNHARNTFVEYTRAIVEPKLRELSAGDIGRDELDQAFKAARESFALVRKIRQWDDKAPAPSPVRKKDDPEFEITDDDTEEFIDDVEDDD
jgi:hypothetical protein